MKKRKSKIAVTSSLRVKVYPVLVEAVEAGVAYGWHRAYKHTDIPTPEDIQEHIQEAVLNELCERFAFDDEDNE